jgi:hypothetical protein
MPLRTTTPIPITPKPTEFAATLIEHSKTSVFENSVGQTEVTLSEHTAAALAATGQELGVRRTRQLRSNWCWAACVDMVLDFYGQPEIRQCDIVGRKLHKPCCSDPFNSKYDVTCDEKDIRAVWNQAGIEARAHLGQLTADNGWLNSAQLVDELNNGRPVQLGLKWDSTGGHAIIVHGWKNSSKGLFFIVNDPWNWAAVDVPEIVNGKGSVHYEELRQAYGMGKWSWTWTGLATLPE